MRGPADYQVAESSKSSQVADSFACSLGRSVESALDERRYFVVFVLLSGGTTLSASTLQLIAHQVFDDAVLLRADLLQNVWKQILDLLRF